MHFKVHCKIIPPTNAMRSSFHSPSQREVCGFMNFDELIFRKRQTFHSLFCSFVIVIYLMLIFAIKESGAKFVSNQKIREREGRTLIV